MKYQIELKRSAQKEMDKLPPKIHRQIAQEILKLENEPRHGENWQF